MLKLPQVTLPYKEYYSHGCYARELTIYAGHILTGAVHKYTNLNIMSKGSMRVSTDDGVFEVHAPFTIVSPPGTKRIAYAITDCVWTTIFGTSLKDPKEIEAEFACFTEQEYNQWRSQFPQLSRE